MDIFNDTELMAEDQFFGEFGYQDLCRSVTNLTG
jgi:hypothetical protein